MKNLVAVILLVFITASCAQAQSESLYQVIHSKYKHGKAEEALDIGLKLFLPAHQKNNLNVLVYKYITGPWDAKIIIPINGEEQIRSLFTPSDVIYQSMVEIAGGESQLHELISKYGDLVLREESELMQLRSDPMQGK